ncbi:hypothetical protein LHV56_12465 [Peribacillus frigoritolerans]|uniref:hypothetical protein n=1 Tax=Peribacillus frigoritolerans TaxID=450367 RepID=UPI00207ABBE9|nr:hypothetical protein [Peribacillus frigoritolerans]USK82633.1 hypothetical protein LHV56_12465 [Peribacillus frigoritolerans]
MPLEKTVNVGARISNGAWRSYTKNMDIMVVSVLEQSLINDTAQTLSKWCLDFGLITTSMYDLIRSKHDQNLKDKHIQILKNNNVIKNGEERVVNDFIHGFKTLHQQLAGTLDRMEKLEIIEYYPVYKGKVIGKEAPINLHENTVNKILQLERRLMDTYDVDDWYLQKVYNSPKSRAYRKDWKEQLAEITDENGVVLKLDYHFKLYAIILKARKKKIIKYLETYNKEAIEQFKKDEFLFLNENEVNYLEERKKVVVENAEKEEGNFLKPRVNKLESEFGGQTKNTVPTRSDYVYDEDYYALYFDRLYAQRIKELQEFYGHNF